MVFGGSNVYGVWDNEGGWVQRLRSYLEASSAENSGISRHYINYIVYNLGIPSSNSQSVLERVQFELRKRVNIDADNIIIFDIGKNDSSVSKASGDFNVLPSVFARNLNEIHGLTNIFSKKIAFMSLLPVDESKTNPVYWSKDLVYKNQYAVKYNGLIKDLCDHTGALFIDIYSIMMARPNWENYFEDGLHLNQKGYRFVFEVVRDTLIKEKFASLKETIINV